MILCRSIGVNIHRFEVECNLGVSVTKVGEVYPVVKKIGTNVSK
jgi:hypothetical protein